MKTVPPRWAYSLMLITATILVTTGQGFSSFHEGRRNANPSFLLLQWASANVRPGPIADWQAALPPVTAPTTVSPAGWPPAIASLKPSNVIKNPGGIILEWGTLSTWGNSRRVFIGANAAAAPPTNDENVLFSWKTLGRGYFAAYQTTD